MTIADAAERIFNEARKFGTVLTLDQCERLARCVLLPPRSDKVTPGEIAQLYRERYGDDHHG